METIPIIILEFVKFVFPLGFLAISILKNGDATPPLSIKKILGLTFAALFTNFFLPFTFLGMEPSLIAEMAESELKRFLERLFVKKIQDAILYAVNLLLYIYIGSSMVESNQKDSRTKAEDGKYVIKILLAFILPLFLILEPYTPLGDWGILIGFLIGYTGITLWFFWS